MRRLALASFVLACALQLPAPLLADAPEEPSVQPLVETHQLAGEEPATATETAPATETATETETVPAEVPAADVPEDAPAEVHGQVMSPVPASEEGGPTEDRLSIGDSVRGSSEVVIVPARQAEEPAETLGGGGEEEPITVPDDGDTDVTDGDGTDEQEPDDEEFEEEFPDEEPEPEPEPEAPRDTTDSVTTTVTPVAEPAVERLPETGADVASLLLVALASLLGGVTLRRASRQAA